MGGYTRRAQALIMPSFDDWEAYEILVPGRAEDLHPRGVKTVWRQSVDISKFRSPVVRLQHGFARLVPTVETFEAMLPLVSVEALLSGAPSWLEMPKPDDSIGIDGTSYEVVVGDGFRWSRHHWWEKPPEGWEPLADFIHDMKQVIESHFAGAV
jgi:hypothetical protein